MIIRRSTEKSFEYYSVKNITEWTQEIKSDLNVDDELHEESCWVSLAGVHAKLFQDLILQLFSISSYNRVMMQTYDKRS